MTRSRSSRARSFAGHFSNNVRAWVFLLAVPTAALSLGGCAIGALVGGMAESYRETSTRSVPAEYDGLTGKSVAVVVTASRSIQADNPGIVALLTQRISERFRDHSGASGWVPPEELLPYLYNNPSWPARSLKDLADELGVERLVFVDLYEYRLNDAGNQYLWNGVAAGTVAVIEADSFAPDSYAYETEVRVQFPDSDGFGPNDFTRQAISSVLAKRFVDRATWPFYTHEEPYYPEY